MARIGNQNARRQRGAALLALLLLFTIVGLSILIKGLSPADALAARDQQTAVSLARAKEAVIGLAATSTTLPGRLPCPEDTSLIGSANEGNQQSSCSNTVPVIGRLPWRTLKTDQLKDGHGEALWYVVSPGFRSAPINTTTTGQLTVNTQPGGYAALIIAPGPPLGSQNRSPISAGAPPLKENYLDGTNASGDALFSTTDAGINDRILGITVAELMAPVAQRVLAQIRGPDDNYPGTPSGGLRNYHNVYGAFPYADADTDGTPDGTTALGRVPYQPLTPVMWLNSNLWYSLVSYERLNSDCARLSLSGTAALYAVPCTSFPCPTNTCP